MNKPGIMYNDRLDGNSLAGKAPDRKWLALVLLGLFFLCFGIWIDVRYPRLDVIAMNDGYSGAFRSDTHPDPLRQIQDEEVVTAMSPIHLFRTTVGDDEFASIEFYYRCVPECEQLWIEPQLRPEVPKIKFLMRHPVLDSLYWFYIEDQQFRLYQQNPEYETISDKLLKGGSDNVLIESSFMSMSGYENENLSLLDDTWELTGSETDIITTYRGFSKVGDWYFYGIRVPVDYFETTEGMIEWKLHHVSQTGTVPEIKLARVTF